MKKLIWKIVLAASLLLMVIAATNIALLIREYQKGINTYANLEKYATVTQDSVKAAQEIKDTADSGNTEEAVEEVIEGPQIAVDLDIDYDALTKINGDFVGWIYYAPLELSYPIVRGIDNDYYTHYTFENVRNSSGAIFMDFLNKPDFSHFNTIIYGHNINGGKMFGALEQYKEKDFFDRHRKIYFTTDRRREYEVFAVMSVNVRKFKYWKFIMARDEKDYDEFAQKVLEHSMWNIGGKPKYKEQMLMLSTCDNGKEDDWRIVVVGKEI